jgi:hypothetical protein
MMAFIGLVAAVAGIWFGGIGAFIALAFYLVYISFMVDIITAQIIHITELMNENRLPGEPNFMFARFTGRPLFGAQCLSAL